MIIKTTIAVLFCLLVFLSSYCIAATGDSSGAYILALVSFVCTTAIYSVGFLGYKIGGKHLELESKVQTLETKASELQLAVMALIKSTYLLTHRETLFDGHSPEQLAIFERYIEPIKHLVTSDIKAEVDADMAKIIKQSKVKSPT